MPGPTSTFGLVERFKKGDTQAFSLIFHKYRRRLAVLVHYRMSTELRAKLEVDDILQEVFLEASQGMKNFSYQSPGNLMAWLSRIADHTLADAARHEKRAKRHAEEMVRFRSKSNPEGPEPKDTETPSRIFAKEEEMKNLVSRLNGLPEEYRRVILLSKFEGLTTSEIAARTGKTRENVALTLHRALKRFRELETTAK
jgi:RNA polymerase sigma-70 factor, ECF subfamily